MQIGDTIYFQRSGGHPGYWYEAKIYGETSRSWLVGKADEWLGNDPASVTRYADKLPKSGTRFATKESADLNNWSMNNRYMIGKAVEACNDGAILRQIADMVGYKEQPDKKK